MHRILVLVVTAGIFLLAHVTISISSSAFAQNLYDQTFYEVSKKSSGLNHNAQIFVGDNPVAIAVRKDVREEVELDTIYVANLDSDTLSIIAGKNNTRTAEDIPVEDPIEIAIHSDLNKIYVARSNNVSVISAENNKVLGEIPINGARAIAVNEDTDTVYVEDSFSGKISVISAENNTEVGSIIIENEPAAIAVSTDAIYANIRDPKNISVISGENNTVFDEIPVGDFVTNIAVDDYRGTDTVYVAHYSSNSISVITTTENNTRKIEKITVGKGPSDIAVSADPNTVYVANADSNSVSVISAENNTVLDEIPVGQNPRNIAVNEDTNTVYVANADSNSVSVIDVVANKVIAGITFQIKPFNSGNIACDDPRTPFADDLTPAVGQYIYVYSGAECTAKPNEGFEFASWDEKNLEDNSTQPISVSRLASTWDSLAAIFGSKPDEPEAKLPITKFGTFTANFKELPPPVPQEYQLLFVSVFLTSIATVLTAWFGSRRKKE